MTCDLYRNHLNGHTCLIWQDGRVEVNGKPADATPPWAKGSTPDATYGPLMPWDGGKCPVPPDTEILARFRGRPPYIGPAIPEQHTDPQNMWQHAAFRRAGKSAYDIIGYQVRVE